MKRIVWIWWGITIVYWGALFAATHTPLPRPPLLRVTDKTGHFVSYALLAAILFVALHLSGRRPASAVGIFVLGTLLLYGAIDEWTQLLVNRSCELADWYADAAGASVAVVVMTLSIRITRGWRKDGVFSV